MTYQILYHVKYVEEGRWIFITLNAEVWEEAKTTMTFPTLWRYVENATF